MNLRSDTVRVSLPSMVAALLFLLTAFTSITEAKAVRYLTGNAGDVRPKLHGPAYDLAGGSTDVFPALQWVIDEVRGCADCEVKLDVVVLRASGADGYNADIAKLGGVDSVETLVIKSREEAESADVEATVRGAEVIFLAGGDQCNYVRYFKGGRVGRAVEAVHARGGGVGGTSAGLAIQGEFSYDGCAGSSQSKNALADPYHKEITFTYDFFRWPPLRGTITDTHFVKRDRMGRTLAFIARQIRDGKARRVLAVAVNEKTSLVVNRRGHARVLGDGPVYFVLGDHPPELCEPGQPLTFSGYKIWKISSGGTFDLRRRPTTGYYPVSVETGRLSANPY